MIHDDMRSVGRLLVAGAFLLAASSASAMPVPYAGRVPVRSVDGELIQKAWHSGMPHRRIVGERVYGGRCPPQGCPAWSQHDLRQDPHTGEWYSPRNERNRYEAPRQRRRHHGNGY